MNKLIVTYFDDDGSKYTYIFTKIDCTHVHMFNYMGSAPLTVASETVKVRGMVQHVAQLKGFSEALYNVIWLWLMGRPQENFQVFKQDW